MLKNSCFQAQQLIKMPLNFYFKVSRQSVIGKTKQPWYWTPLCWCSSCDIKRTRKSKGAHGCAGKKFNGGFCKVRRELWQTEEQIWRKRSSSVSTASSILTTKPKHIFIASSQIIFNWKIHAEWRQIRWKKQETVFYSRIWNQKGEAVKYETIKQLSKNRQRNYHLQKSASAGE